MKLRHVVVIVAAMLSAGCGNDRQAPAGGATGPADRENVVEVEATEYAYSLPEEVTGGVVTFEFLNAGREPHEFGFARLDDGKTVDDLQAAFESRKNPKWAQDLAGIPVLSPGLSVEMTRELDPGTYAFYCFLPAAADRMSHIAHGMIQGFEVAGDSDAEVPDAEFVVSVTDQGFDLPDIPAGRHLVEFRNDGTKSHELAVISFEPGKKERDLGKWFGGGYDSPPPALFPGGIQSIDPGASVVMEIEFVKGRTYRIEDFPNRLSSEFVAD